MKEITYLEFKKALNVISKYKQQEENKYKNINNEINSVLKNDIINKDFFICDLDISLRLINLLKAYSKRKNINLLQIKDLDNISISDIKKYMQSNPTKSIKELHELSVVYNFNIID